jgi:hypothetical protein
LHSVVAQHKKINILNNSKNKLVTVEVKDVPYASSVINLKNAQVNTSLGLASGYLAKILVYTSRIGPLEGAKEF